MFISQFHTPIAFISNKSRQFVSTSILMRAKNKQKNFLDFNFDSSSTKSFNARYKPRSVNQQVYLDTLKNNSVPIVIGSGPAGSGKTLFACLEAIQQLRSKSIDKIILTRPVVPVEEEELGFLPGNLVKKMDPWTRPLIDIFLEFYHQKEIDNMINSGTLEISPLAYMRGRTFKRTFIIADEMQNSTPNQMLMLTTRMGELSKMVITGDIKQSDRAVSNGLGDLINKVVSFSNYNNDALIKVIFLNSNDIQRSAVVSQILTIYEDSCKNSDIIVSDNLIDKFNNNYNRTSSNHDAALIPLKDLPKNNF
jgi:phosphate starvation-inducible PhoH-like protein